jgi:diguanylate cyclase (GGDEF)-like protein
MDEQQYVLPATEILIVDDKVENLDFLAQMLREHSYKVRLATNAKIAFKSAKVAPPNLVLLDINMPGINGYELCRLLKKEAKTQDIPVIFLSASGQTFNKVEAFAAGGVDYITKPFDISEVIVRIENQLKLKSAQAEVIQLNSTLEQKIQERTAQLEAEIQKRERAQAKLLRMALHDSLTNLPNRSGFLQKLKQELEKTQQQQHYQFAVIGFDCDNFKVINDSLGHSVGDSLLKAIPSRLKSCLPQGIFMARLGGDEFIILLPQIKNLATAISATEKIQQEFTVPFSVGKREIFLNFSLGIVLGTAEYDQPEKLLRNADLAMYQAKALGKGQYQVYNQQMHQRAVERLQLEIDLRQALKNNEFTLHYQPIVCLKTGHISGFESLVRWQHPQLGMISPGKFIPVAEETGLIIPLGIWVLKEACRQIKVWQEKYDSFLSLTVNINVAVQQFSYSRLIVEIDKILAETQLSSSCLKLEITESAIMENSDSAHAILQQLRDRNIKICIDDFGTGYSSLSYLHQFPVDNLKIDRSFVSRIKNVDEPNKVIDAIVNLAHHLDITVTAEGIETEAQLDYIRKVDCEYAQGYHFSKPLNAEAVEAMQLLHQKKSLFLNV